MIYPNDFDFSGSDKGWILQQDDNVAVQPVPLTCHEKELWILVNIK